MGNSSFRIPTSAAQESAQNAGMPNGGELFVPPAYMQTTGDQAVQLDAATDGIAFGFPVTADFAISSLSAYLTAVAVEGNANITIHADGTALEPNGRYSTAIAASDPTMTANNLPAPNVVALKDNAGANAEAGAGYEAFEGMDGSVAADNGTRSNAAPTAPAPIYFTVDLGEGVTLAVNKFRISSFSNASADIRAFPKAFTFWGSNGAAPAAQTDGDWTALTGSSAWTAETDPGAGFAKEYYVNNATGYRHYRLKITDRTGVNAYVAIGELEFFVAQLAQAPGTQLADLGTMGSGAAADAWIRKVLSTAYQCTRQSFLWIKFLGTAAKDFSFSTRRWNVAQGSMFPDGCITKTSTAAGIWTQAEQDSKPALMNIVINSSANHCPQLHYGRRTGAYDYIPGVGIKQIPLAGISLACDDLTATSFTALSSGTRYNVDLYDNAGTLALVQYTTATSESAEGIIQGAANRKFLGIMYVINLVSTKQGPIDVMDARLLRNLGRPKLVGKHSPYAAFTTQVIYPINLPSPIGSTASDFTLAFALLDGECIRVEIRECQIATASQGGVIVGYDGVPVEETQGSMGYTQYSTADVKNIKFLSSGIHSATPYFLTQANQMTLRLWMSLGAHATKMNIQGEILCQ